MLEYTRGDVARTTDIMDNDAESLLLGQYSNWTKDNAKDSVESENKKFFECLLGEVIEIGMLSGRQERL